MALRNLNIPHEVVATAEIDKYAVISYAAIHCDLENELKKIGIKLKKNKIEILYDKIMSKLTKKGYQKVTKKDVVTLLLADKLSKNLGDISKLTIEQIPNHDLFTYSFPCQDISIAGRQRGLDENSGTRSSLLWECRKVIKGKKPKYLLFENVKNLVGVKHKENFDKWLEWLEEQGYNNYWEVLNAKDYGIPQNRERVFVISIRKDVDDGKFSFEEPRELKLRLKDLLEDEVDENFYYSEERTKDLLKTLNEKGLGKELKQECIERINIEGHDYLKRVYNPNGISPTVTSCGGGNTEPKIAHCPQSREYNGFKDECPTLTARDYKDPKTVLEKVVCEQRTDEGLRFFKGDYCGTIRIIDAGGDKRVLEPKIQQLNNPKHSQQRIYSKEGIAPTLCAGNKGGGKETCKHLTDNYRIRKLTPKECWRLMGFKDEDFEKAAKFNSNTQLYKQTGNSICVNVLESIFKSLFLHNK